MKIEHLTLSLILAPLIGALIVGFFRRHLGRVGAHSVTILGVSLSFALSLYIAIAVFSTREVINVNVFTWADGGKLFPYAFHIGLLIDALTAVMLVVVTFVSLLVHVYSIGYMDDDPGYQRFFSYISLFTFMMLMLVTANNFLQLFFGWEGVGLVSYLLIGFWYQKQSAIDGGLKAFLVNRVGDLGFILGVSLILAYTGSLSYDVVFNSVNFLSHETIALYGQHSFPLVTVICILLFIGAMAKSAQVPLHVWLPESMEGPTPISALIHAATMVTAGVFMVARMSPLFEQSTQALSFILVIGATGALFTGMLALVMNDIKRVIAYSTLSQLGYMMVAMGVSGYNLGIFHLLTHACFKALLFLGAGSVILGMHHEQDMRKMGGLWRKMPITYITFFIGTLALCAIPPFAGFYSKDTIIEAAKLSVIPGSSYAYICVLIGAMVTALYSFRALFMIFHGNSHKDNRAHESAWVIWLPLIVLAIPSVVLGYLLYLPILSGSLLRNSIVVLPVHDVIKEIAAEAMSPIQLISHAPMSATFWLTLLGTFLAWIGYIIRPSLPGLLACRFQLIYQLLIKKYGLDTIYDRIFVAGFKSLGQCFYQFGDQYLIDGFFVNGTAYTVNWLAQKNRLLQTGYVYHYAIVMITGLLVFLCWLLLG